MHEFWESAIHPYLDWWKPKRIVEIGAEAGQNTFKLLDYCRRTSGELFVIDPQPVFNVNEVKAAYGPHFHMFLGASLSILPLLGPYDAVLIDGDHNWYTVYHELKLVEQMSISHGRPVTIFVHDIGWPYGRRDMYYNPDTVPAQFRKPYARKGMVPGITGLVDQGGLNDGLNNAVYEYGSQNGVLTAVEDFLRETKLTFGFHQIHDQHGLGILDLRP